MPTPKQMEKLAAEAARRPGHSRIRGRTLAETRLELETALTQSRTELAQADSSEW
jgi:hypothetical protein